MMDNLMLTVAAVLSLMSLLAKKCARLAASGDANGKKIDLRSTFWRTTIFVWMMMLLCGTFTRSLSHRTKSVAQAKSKSRFFVLID
jgi:hypothetical protein